MAVVVGDLENSMTEAPLGMLWLPEAAEVVAQAE
jgi:hypothetical protein